MNEVNDLVENLKKGDREAFKALYELYESSLINHLFRMLGSQERAEEVFQESMLAMLRKIHFYTPRSDLKDSFKAWLFRLSTNLAIDEIRRSKKLEKDSEKEALDTTFLAVEQADKKEKLNDLIMQLPAIQRTFLNLKINEDMSHFEIATICGCHINAVKQGLFRARKSLKNLMLEEDFI